MDEMCEYSGLRAVIKKYCVGVESNDSYKGKAESCTGEKKM